jgi:hypothetical protein
MASCGFNWIAEGSRVVESQATPRRQWVKKLERAAGRAAHNAAKTEQKFDDVFSN